MDWYTRATLLTVAVSLLMAALALKESRNANRLAVLASFLKEYRDLEPQRHFVLRKLPDGVAEEVTHGLAASGRARGW